MTSCFFALFFHVFERLRNINAINSTCSKGLATKFCFSVVVSQARVSPYGQPCTLMNSPPGILQPQVAEHNILAAYPLPQWATQALNLAAFAEENNHDAVALPR